MTGSCIYAGSFDPVTKGHIDIITRAADLFDTVYVGVLNNSVKQYLFPMETRLEMVQKATQGIAGGIQIAMSDGLLVRLMEQLGTRVILRGVRSNADLELEQQLAEVNAKLLPGVETVLLLAGPGMQHISSTIVRELIAFGADISEYVPREVIEMIDRRNTR